jgi:hypothetical protein
MSESAFNDSLAQLKSAVGDQFDARRTLAAVLLLYTSIDILASLTRQESADATSGRLFKDWVNDYMLTESSLPCSADDLWAARCGLLHTLTAESDMSRAGRAKTLNYIYGDVSVAERVQRDKDPARASDIFLSTSHLLETFLSACDRFAAEVRSNSDLQQRVYSHAAKLMRLAR